jgi:hypothetical protein
LGLNKIDAMFRAIGLALCGAEFEAPHSMENIPYLALYGRSALASNKFSCKRRRTQCAVARQLD